MGRLNDAALCGPGHLPTFPPLFTMQAWSIKGGDAPGLKPLCRHLGGARTPRKAWGVATTMESAKGEKVQ